MNRTLSALIAALAAVAFSACPRSQPPAAKPAPATAPSNAPAAIRPPATVPPATTVTPPAAAVPPAPADIPLRVSALMEIGGESRAGVIEPKTGRGVTLRVGEAFLGYKLTALDLDKQVAVFERDGQVYRLGTVGDPTPLLQPPPGVSADSPAPGPGLPPPGMDFSKLPPPPHFDPTDDETRRGIDPNNPATWPADYRGPGIERAMKELEKKQAEALNAPNAGR